MHKSKDPGLKKSLKGHNDTVSAIDFNPDGTQVASGSLDASVLIWKINAKQVPYKFVGHTAEVHSIAFNPAGTLIATGSADHTVRLWENDMRGVSTCLKSHSGAVRACSFSFDGQFLLTGSDDKYLKIFTVHNRRHMSTINAHANWIRAAEFSPDSRLITSASDDKTVKLWDSEQLTQISTFEDTSSFLSSRFHPDGTCLASGTLDGKVCVWDIRSQLLLQMYTDAHSDSVNSVVFHSSGRYLLTGSNDATMKIFDLRKGTLMYSLYGHEGAVQAVNFSRDGTLFGSGGTDWNLILWESNLVDPEQEAEVVKLKKMKEDSKNLGKRKTGGTLSATEKFNRIQKKKKQTMKKIKEEDHENSDKENDSGAANTPSKYETLAEDLAGMMDKITSQLDIITRTVVTLEKRIGNNEELVDEAYHSYKTHQKNAEIRESISLAQEEKRIQEDQEGEGEGEGENEEDKKEFDPSKSVKDLSVTRAKVRDIMNIINVSQYSLAAVHKSAAEIKEETNKLREDLTPSKNTNTLRSPIDEESEDDFSRDA